VITEKPDSITVEIPGGTIHGLHTGQGHNRKMLCLHGWLDNANSFVPMMPHLQDTEIVAIDLPGHGHSDHYTVGTPYTIASYAHRVLQVAEALNWDQFYLTGHSLGGSIAPLCAVAAPEKIKALIMIDALGPLSETAQELPQRIKRYHEDFNNPKKHSGRVYESMELAVEARLLATKMEQTSARLIVERQLRETSNGYQWRFDRQLRLASPAYYTEDQVREILKAVSCPVLCVIAADGYIVAREEMTPRLNMIQHKTVEQVAGFHHLHMDSPKPVAEVINAFAG
jgi:pimeloyl-ACP methyl ester carboxylesterase